MTVGKRNIFRKVVHNKCFYVHDKIIQLENTVPKNQQAMQKIIFFFILFFFFKQQILHKVFRLLKCSPAAAPKPTERLATTTNDDDMRKKTLLTSVDYQVSEQLPDWFKCSASATPSDSRKKKKKNAIQAQGLGFFSSFVVFFNYVFFFLPTCVNVVCVSNCQKETK